MIHGAWGLGKAHGWRNPYITDGLVAMWDGEWNAGGGMHDPAATTWIDVVSGCVAASSSPFAVTSNGMVKTGSKTMFATLANQLAADAEVTLEVCMYATSGNSGVWGSGAVSSLFKSDDKLYVTKGFDSITQRSIAFVKNGAATASFLVKSSGISAYHNATLSRFFSGGGTQNTTQNITLGWGRSATNSTTYHCFRFYSRALTAAEIAANYAIDKARFNLP